MNWEAIGAIGEIVGAFAVVVSLIYLALQIRHSRKAAEAQSTISTADMASRWRGMLLQNSDLSDTLAKANSNETLSPSERIKLHNLSDDLIVMCAVSHAHNSQSGSLHDISGAVEYLMRQIDENPALANEWRRLRSFTDLISKEFCQAVEKRLPGAAAELLR
jgi:RNA polymerase-interacting CarD/CdnL/TRCF family regulator